MKKPLISVIIPVYNVMEYLKACLDSVCRQTFHNIEIILVDDGSTDGSAFLCDQYAKIDKRLHVIHKENGGLVSARKAGVQISTGDYITFVDSDDWIDENTYEKLYNHMIQNNFPDVLSFGCIEEYLDHKVYLYNSVSIGLYQHTRLSELKKEMLKQDSFFVFKILPHLCDKLIKRKIIEICIQNVPDYVSFGEDAACSFPCIWRANTFLSINDTPYHYRQREGSIVKSRGELPYSNFTGIYSVLREFIHLEDIRYGQLKLYMYFLLLLKSYTKIESEMLLFPFEKISEGSKIFVYGAGGFGRVIADYLEKSNKLIFAGWTDKRAAFYKKEGWHIDLYESLFQKEYDYLVIAILNETLAQKIKEEFVHCGIPEEKIDYVKKEMIKNTVLPKWLLM